MSKCECFYADHSEDDKTPYLQSRHPARALDMFSFFIIVPILLLMGTTAHGLAQLPGKEQRMFIDREINKYLHVQDVNNGQEARPPAIISPPIASLNEKSSCCNLFPIIIWDPILKE